jgi:hypothetical protein
MQFVSVDADKFMYPSVNAWIGDSFIPTNVKQKSQKPLLATFDFLLLTFDLKATTYRRLQG